MLVLLPPSESKRAPEEGGPVLDLAALSFAELNPVRARLLTALADTSARDDALTRLGVGPSVAEQVRGNTRLGTAACRPALELYDGVLYDALDAPSLTAAARRRARTALVIASGLWGAVRPDDLLPAYRCPIGADLIGTGRLAASWRQVLPAALATAAGRRGVVVDCRSSGYLAAGRPIGLGGRSAEIRVLRESAGRRTVVSHLAKHTRGQVARHLLDSGTDPATVPELVEVLRERWTVEPSAPVRSGAPWRLDLVLT